MATNYKENTPARLAELERENAELRKRLDEADGSQTDQGSAGPAGMNIFGDEGGLARLILETASEGLWVIDASEITTHVNPKMAEMLGFEPGEVIGRPYTDFLFPEDLPDHQEQMRMRREGRSTKYQRRLRAKDGRELWAMVSACPLQEGGKHRGSFALFTDVTERRETENRLRRSELFNRSLVAHLPQRIFLKDAASLYLSCNENYARDLGLKPEEVVGKDDFAFHPRELAEKYRTDDRKVLESGQILDSVERYRVGGEDRWIHTIKVPFRTEQGEIIGVLGIFDDITERKRAEDALEKRILALTRPLEEDETIAFEDLFNLEDIQRIQDEFALATGTGSLITRPDGTPITRPSNFCQLCGTIIRQSEKGRRNCENSDAKLGRDNLDGPTIHTCLSAGLCNAGAGITIGGRHVANWLVGQVRDGTQDPKELRSYARDIGVDEQAFMEAYNQVPFMPRPRFEMVAKALFSLAKQLSTTAYQNVQQARFISERKQAEKALQNSERTLAQIIEFLPDATWVIDKQGRVIAWNKAIEKLTGVPKEEMLGQGGYAHAVPFYGERRPVTADLLLQPDEEFTSNYHTFRKTGDTIFSEAWIPDFQGRGLAIFWNAASALRDVQGEVIGAVESVRDVTDRWKAEQDLKKSRQSYRELMDSVSDLIYTQDMEGRFTSFNAAVTEILGYRPEALLGHKASEWMKPEFEAEYESQYLDELKSKGSAKGISMYFHKDGSRKYLEYQSRLVREPGGEPYISGIGRDVTERVQHEKRLRQLQNQLLQSQKMEAVGTLAGGIAHDFNNLLAAILGYAEIAQDPRFDQNDSRHSIGQIIRAAERARELVKKILTFSRKMDTDLRPLNLNRVVEQSQEILERTLPKMIKIETSLAPDLYLINADVNQMEQILLNLATNAADAMPQGGRLSIETQNLTLTPEYSQEHLDMLPGQYVGLLVSDTGEGIDQSIRDRIFEPFFTTKGPGKGTGLGLSTVYGVVASHGGSVHCYSEPGQGTTFKIFLPIHPDQEHKLREDGQQTAPLTGGDETILLVDDEESLREVGSLLLHKLGYRVVTASSGEEGLGLYQEMDPKPDLVILDLGMPGMGGFKAMEEIRGLNPKARVIIASGYSAKGQVQQALEQGAAAFVPKPFRVEELAGTVRQVLDR